MPSDTRMTPTEKLQKEIQDLLALTEQDSPDQWHEIVSTYRRRGPGLLRVLQALLEVRTHCTNHVLQACECSPSSDIQCDTCALIEVLAATDAAIREAAGGE
jgi:hypothetical protein